MTDKFNAAMDQVVAETCQGTGDRCPEADYHVPEATY